MELKTDLQLSLNQLRRNQPVILIDDASRETRGYLVANAATCAPEVICQAVNNAKGLIFVALSEGRIRELGLPMMVNYPQPGSLELTVSVDSRLNSSTGISASDRANTVRTLALTTSPRTELVVPGHLFPIRARNGGVLVKLGPAEAAVDLVRAIGGPPAALMVECLNCGGDYASLAELAELSKSLSAPAINLSELVEYRLKTEPILEKVTETELPVANYGVFRAIAFESKHDQTAHLALVKGEIDLKTEAGEQLPIYARVQAETGLDETLGIRIIREKGAVSRLSSRDSLKRSLELINQNGRGILVFVRHPRSGLLSRRLETIRWELDQSNKLEQPKAGRQQTASKPESIKEYGIGAQVLQALGARRLILLGGSKELSGIGSFSLEIVDNLPLN